MPVPYVPAGHNCLSPYLVVTDAALLIDFVKHVFDAADVLTMPGPDGRVAHAELRIGDTILMLGQSAQPFPAQLHCYVANVDDVYARALATGATSLRPPTDMPHGDRLSLVKDTQGNVWAIATHGAAKQG